METEQRTEQEIIIPRDRKYAYLLLTPIIFPTLPVIILCSIIAFRSHDEFDKTFAPAVICILLLTVIFSFWLVRRSIRLIFSDVPVLRINHQGITLIDPYKLQFKITLIPWSEIAKISCFHSQALFFTITLKDPQGWWLRAGNQRRRKFLPNRRFGGAHFIVNYTSITTKLIQQIQENYAHEIQVNEVQLVPFASRFTNS